MLLEFLENGARFEERKDTTENQHRGILYGNTQNTKFDNQILDRKDNKDAIDLQNNTSLDRIQTPVKTNFAKNLSDISSQLQNALQNNLMAKTGSKTHIKNYKT